MRILGSREPELKFTVLVFDRSHRNLATVQADDVFDDIQSQPHPLLIQAAGTVGFIKPFENVRHFGSGNAGAAVAHTAEYTPVVRRNGKSKRAVLVHELGGVVKKVIYYLPDEIKICRHGTARGIFQTVYRDPLVIQPSFK